MVNGGVTGPVHKAYDAERDLAWSYAPERVRLGLDALWALDGTCAGILRSTREPLIGQMRLRWWHDALIALDSAPAPAEPVLTAIAADVLPSGVTGTALAEIASGWEMLLADPLDEAALVAHAGARGGGLFDAASVVLGARSPEVADAGKGWALVDVSRNLSDQMLGSRARMLAGECLARALARRWPRPLRALGALALSASMDLAEPPRPAGHPMRVARLLRFRLTGR